MKKKFQKMLILVFEVIVQPPKTHFLTFSKMQKTHYGEKSETKIMKITQSDAYICLILQDFFVKNWGKKENILYYIYKL